MPMSGRGPGRLSQEDRQSWCVPGTQGPAGGCTVCVLGPASGRSGCRAFCRGEDALLWRHTFILKNGGQVTDIGPGSKVPRPSFWKQHINRSQGLPCPFST